VRILRIPLAKSLIINSFFLAHHSPHVEASLQQVEIYESYFSKDEALSLVGIQYLANLFNVF